MKRNKILWITGLVSSAVIGLACSSGDGNNSNSNGGGTKVTVKVGEPAKDGKFEFVVSSVKCNIISVGKGILEKLPQGEFCILSLSVKNIGNESQLFDDSSQYLYDDKGKKYSSDTEASFSIEGNNDVFLTEINPGNKVSVQVAFDVPKGTKIVMVELHDSAFSGGIEVTI